MKRNRVGVKWSELCQALPSRRGRKRISHDKKWAMMNSLTTDNVSLSQLWKRATTRHDTPQDDKEELHIKVMEAHASMTFKIVVIVVDTIPTLTHAMVIHLFIEKDGVTAVSRRDSPSYSTPRTVSNEIRTFLRLVFPYLQDQASSLYLGS